MFYNTPLSSIASLCPLRNCATPDVAHFTVSIQTPCTNASGPLYLISSRSFHHTLHPAGSPLAFLRGRPAPTCALSFQKNQISAPVKKVVRDILIFLDASVALLPGSVSICYPIAQINRLKQCEILLFSESNLYFFLICGHSFLLINLLTLFGDIYIFYVSPRKGPLRRCVCAGGLFIFD